MAQGFGKLSKGKASVASANTNRRNSKHHASNNKKNKAPTVTKGPKYAAPSTTKPKNDSKRAEVETTKAINRKNEALIAAKAVAAGSQFFLQDVQNKGTKEMNKQLQERTKKETKVKKSIFAEKVKSQLRKLGRDV